MRKRKLLYTVATVLSRSEYRALQRYVTTQDKSTSEALRELIQWQVSGNVALPPRWNLLAADDARKQGAA